ncbi:hypothetical protein L195_g022297 [Trifolium pratense]|uniref:Uncharacterized protein n=1 Tax=Trifolium pratense TaxID=57577 RepID=A0A2K3N7N9_TRIPR|nr:hypothetical protein L195_g022297 [Trifolium pratense]
MCTKRTLSFWVEYLLSEVATSEPYNSKNSGFGCFSPCLADWGSLSEPDRTTEQQTASNHLCVESPGEDHQSLGEMSPPALARFRRSHQLLETFCFSVAMIRHVSPSESV